MNVVNKGTNSSVFLCQVWSETTKIQLLDSRRRVCFDPAKFWLIAHTNRNIKRFGCFSCFQPFQLKTNLTNTTERPQKKLLNHNWITDFSIYGLKLKLMKTSRKQKPLRANKTINRIENLTRRSTGRLAPSPEEVTIWPHSGSSERPGVTVTPTTNPCTLLVNIHTSELLAEEPEELREPDLQSAWDHSCRKTFFYSHINYINRCAVLVWTKLWLPFVFVTKKVQQALQKLWEEMSGAATSVRYTKDWAHEPFPDVNQTICEWKHSKYNIGRQKDLKHSETVEQCGDRLKIYNWPSGFD